jgi:uncharacterized membrane protein
LRNHLLRHYVFSYCKSDTCANFISFCFSIVIATKYDTNSFSNIFSPICVPVNITNTLQSNYLPQFIAKCCANIISANVGTINLADRSSIDR